MITPSQIHQKAQKLWNSGRILQTTLNQEQLFPWQITFRKPSAKQQVEGFIAVREWVSRLKSQSKEANRKVNSGGYEIEYKTINHRQLGTQQLPSKIVFSTQNDLLQYLGQLRQFEALLKMAHQTDLTFPILKDWLINKPRTFMKYFSIWAELLAVCDYFIKNPQPTCYLRELEISGIDSKFIERNTNILAELLDLILPPKAINQPAIPAKLKNIV
jgi:hypothetical protein